MKLISGSAIPLAVSVEVYKRAVHILDEDVDQDSALTFYLGAAQDVIEAATGRPLGVRQVEFDVPPGAWSQWWFPVAPVSKIDKVSWLDDAGDWVELSADEYRLLRPYDEPSLRFTGSVCWGANGLQVQATVGHAISTWHRGCAQAIILTAKDWFEAGIAVEEYTQARLHFCAETLIKQVRYRRPLETLI